MGADDRQLGALGQRLAHQARQLATHRLGVLAGRQADRDRRARDGRDHRAGVAGDDLVDVDGGVAADEDGRRRFGQR